MKRLADALVPILLTLWVGGMWAIGYIAAPTLFAMLPRALAGQVAGRLFEIVGWIGIGTAVYLLACLFVAHRLRAMRTAVFWLVLTMLAMTLASQFGIQPLMAQLKATAWPREVMDSVMRDRFAAWHGVSSVLYLLQSVLGAVLVSMGGRFARP